LGPFFLNDLSGSITIFAAGQREDKAAGEVSFHLYEKGAAKLLWPVQAYIFSGIRQNCILRIYFAIFLHLPYLQWYILPYCPVAD
jgi:hypothetical protein